MECLDLGALRAYLDEEVSPAEKATIAEHVASCVTCREALASLSAQAEAATALLAVLAPGGVEVVPAAAALRTYRRRRAERRGLWQRLQGGLIAMSEGSWLRGWRGATAALSLLAVVLLLFLTPAAGALGDWLSVFRAEKFAPVTIDPAKVSDAAPKLNPSDMGEFKVRVEPQHKQVADVAAAQSQVDFPVRRLGSVPAGVKAAPQVSTTTAGDFTYVFNLAKTKAALAQAGVNVQLPAELDGATVRVYIPAAVQQMYAPTAGSEGGLMLYESHSPTLELPGVLDTPQMRSLFYQLSGLPPEVIDQLKAISDQKSTVPVPVVKGDTSKQVTVDGTQGLLVTHKPAMVDSAGPEGSYLIWQKDGVVYAIGGTVSESDLLAAANSLK
jgi:hypothetical protein